MKCHKLLYKPYRKTAPYEDFIRKQKQKEDKLKKQFIYEEILKFRQSRYPLDFLKQLEDQINPFQLSLEKLKQLFSSKHPEYSNELVNESVEHIFNRKCQQSQMIKESAMIIQYGQEYIRNGRKLLKEDFTYEFSNYGEENNTKINISSQGRETGRENNSNSRINPLGMLQSLQKMKSDEPKQNNPLSSDRNPLTTDRLLLTARSRSDSPSKIVDMMHRTERFNELLLEQIKRDKKRFQNLQDIQEGSPLDSIYHYQNTQPMNYTDRSKNNQSLPSFRESDLIVRPDLLDTGRSEVEQLNFLLSSLNFQEGGQQTVRSKKSKNTLRINRQIKEQLYNARGTLKLDIVRRAIQRLKQEQRQGRPQLSGSHFVRN